MSLVFYFAYGSNMDPATLRGRRGIEWTRAMPARLPGWRLELAKPSLLGTGEAMATIVPDPESEVWGVLYELGEADLEHLELTEGVRIGHYERREVVVRPGDDGERSEVETVTLVSDSLDPSLRPTTRYMDLLVRGAIAHGLPEAWIELLRAIEAVEESAESARWRPLVDGALSRSR